MNVNEQIKKYKQKIYFNSIINSLVYGLISGLIISLVVTIILYCFKVKNIVISLSVFGLCLIIFSILAYFRYFKVTKESIARKLDSLGLDERVITMVEYQEENSELITLQRNDTIEKLQNVSTRDIKIQVKKIALILLLVLMFVFSASFFLPNPKPFGDNPVDPGTQDKPLSEEDLIIKEMLEKIRQIIDESGLEQILKDCLYDKVNELEEALKECTTLNQKVTLIKKAMKEIQDIIDYYLTERNLGQALQMYDPFTKEDFLTLDLGLAVNEKDLPGVDSSLEELKQQLLSASNQRSNSFDEIKEAYAEDLDEALKRATLEDNEALITAIANFRDALLTATPENIVEVIEVAKEEIKKALMEDPSGTKEDQAAEDAKEDISDAMQDALDKLEKEEAEEEDEIESEGEEDQEDQQEKPTVNPDKPFESEPIIDGNTPYLPEYEKYAEIINQILSSYEGEEIPEDVRKIIEEYLEMLK